jgi:hypothetical protein
MKPPVALPPSVPGSHPFGCVSVQTLHAHGVTLTDNGWCRPTTIDGLRSGSVGKSLRFSAGTKRALAETDRSNLGRRKCHADNQ